MPNNQRTPIIPTTQTEANSPTTPPSANPSYHHIASPTDAQDPNTNSAPAITPTSPANPPLTSCINDHHYIMPPTDVQDPPAPPMEQLITAITTDISTNHPMAPSGSTSTSAQPTPEPTAAKTPSLLAPPTQIEYPYGYAEGVGVSTSQISNAGRRLFGLRPLQEAPHLFAKQGQFICTYATQRH
jgi:hypothetical protein